MFTVYLIQNKINKKIYIGQTCRSFKTRFIEHMSNPTNQYLKNSIKKYGKQNFSIIELETFTDQNECDEAEDFFMGYFQSKNREFGYNFIDSRKSRAGVPLSAEHKAKISAFMKGRFSGDKNPMFGKKISEETRLKLGHKKEKHHRFGKECSQELKDKISKSLTGHKISDECKQKLSVKFSGSNNPASKINLEIANQIRELYKSGSYSQKQLGVMFNLKKSQVGNIVNNLSWKAV